MADSLTKQNGLNGLKQGTSLRLRLVCSLQNIRSGKKTMESGLETGPEGRLSTRSLSYKNTQRGSFASQHKGNNENRVPGMVCASGVRYRWSSGEAPPPPVQVTPNTDTRYRNRNLLYQYLVAGVTIRGFCDVILQFEQLLL